MVQIKKDHLNFAVGPVQIADYISDIGAETVPYFRTADFSELMLENEQIMKQLLNASGEDRVVFLTGSGTAAMDASVSNLLTEEDKALVIKGGGFGERFCEICEVYGVPYTAIELEWGKTLTAKDLIPFVDQGYTAFLVNMGETSSGVLYDMNLIGNFCKENNLFLIVDAISTFISDPIDMANIGADVILTGSQKALALPPGLSIMALSPAAIKRATTNSPKSYYLNLASALKNGERGQTPWTPAVGILIQLNARLNQLAGDGLASERKHIESLAEDFRRRIIEYPFEICSNMLSNSLTPLRLKDDSKSAKQVFEVLKNQYGIIVCPNGGAQADSIFRVGHIGNLEKKDNDTLFAAFDELVKNGVL